ncbi:MAG: toll/interleukin-1 receptor domain-containing protein [Candidatus Electrothrix aestuarii]|uniref:Toll/interleukin-1 receptor domain-containing protein n=1 Tax=Candidatus Electrothrix aestuarii TaxID=3062594 RepID=A0AAU8LYW7_9BACT|nr:toll/interleukin-1 receptor domain-containing protein [Candidatus Electrothrix aestuarii]
MIPTNKFVFNNYYVIQGVPDDFTYKVFISHSWDDKERFVTEFAIKLRGRGVDAWVDQWEMMPGDSLVRKIFCEGIQNAEAFIIVLSKNSVQKKWVKEELDLAVVKKIEEGARLIPIVIDDCNIPAPLKSTVWVKINELKEYQNEFEKIVMAIFGQTNKPPLGPPPNYVSNDIISFSSLGKTDSIIFNAICEKALEKNEEFQISAYSVFCSTMKYEIDKESFNESLLLLAHKQLIRIPGPVSFRCSVDLTSYGVSYYINERVPEIEEIEKTIVCELVNTKEGQLDFGDINIIYRHYVLQKLANNNLISYTRTLGGMVIQGVSPLLKRFAAELYN